MKKLSFILFMLASALFVQAQTIEQTYHFTKPTVKTVGKYHQIGFHGCLPNGIVGEPSLPWQSVSLMLPQGQEAVSINIEFADFEKIEGNYNLMPAQQPRPVSCEKEIPFAKNESIYRSENVYPTRSYNKVTTQYLNGVAFAFSGFTPVQYVPATGKVSYAQTVKVTIETQASRDDQSRKLWLTPNNEQSIKRLAQNANMLSSYNKRGHELGGYDMLVITSEEWIPRFGDYMNLYNDKGIRTRIVALEEIYATMEGRDEPEQIRNYIIQEYENNGIQMVSLGGDVSIVPFRFLWCFAQEGDEDQLPSDMYYACLDGTLNDDNDDRWGEVGEDDLLPELGIGRLPFNNEAQFETIMHKTFSYLQNPVLGEFTSPILGAEHLGDGYYGDVDMERLIGEVNDYDYTTHGYPEDYNFKRYYASPTLNWSGNAFRDVICTGGQYVHHVGHANDDFVAGWTGSMMPNNYFAGNDGINHNYQIFHSHGCICGNFPVSCVLEKMITIETGFVVTTGNSRYGWYVPWGDGMAAHIHREFIDAYCNDHIATVGMALREAKIATAPWVSIPFEKTRDAENGCMRWNIYCLNVLGDAALFPWFEEPVTPDVSYPQGIKQGSQEFDVCVSNTGGTHRDFENFTVSLFKGDQLLARGVTASNGTTTLYPDDPEELVGDMELVVTGQSAWPQSFTVRGFTDEEPLLYAQLGTLHDNGNGLLEPGETIRMDLGIINPSNIDLHNVEINLSCDDEQIELEDRNATIALVEANTDYLTSYLNPDGAFSFVVKPDVDDEAHLYINVELNAEGLDWHSVIPVHLSAPVMQFAEVNVDDSQGDQNGFIDQGETITLTVNGMNIGHAIANDAYLTVSCDDERIHFMNDSFTIGEVDINDTFSADVTFTSDDDIIGGSVFHFNMTLHTGAYETHFDYVFSIGIATETFESGDFSFLDWFHEGDTPWFVTDSDAHNGTYSARSGAIDDDEVSRLIVYADNLEDGEISFWFKTSTELRRDYFAFFIDNAKQDWWSGENDWTYASYDFEAGSHRFLWLYDKNGNGVAGEDCAWIDDITFPRTCIITKVEEDVVKKENAIYPNPTTGSFTIELAEESNVSIFNMLGQSIMSLEKVSGHQQVSLEGMAKGMYFVRIQNNSNLEIKKITLK